MDVSLGSSTAVSRPDGAPDYKAIKQGFLAVNGVRRERIRAGLRGRQCDVFELLPLLFHLNHPLLPGYVGATAPAGIPGYEAGAAALEAVRRLVRGFAPRRRAYRRHEVHALYLMGSTGTIAYSEASDLDLWVCHDPGLAEERLSLLRDKARGIEAWAHGLGLDLHCFLVDPARLRQGEPGALSRESSGSALRHLLLDEFYRTGVWLAGRYPLWWFVPPEEEACYSRCAERLQGRRFVDARDAIDFGGLDGMAAEEFYGATLWLLYKAIDSPYKSLLKVLLMEAYATEYPAIELLSARFKRAVYAGERDTDALDPYLMLMDKVGAHLAARGETRRLELARRCLYFKVDQPLSRAGAADWRRERLQALTHAWGWRFGDLVLLDSRGAWSFAQVEAERRVLVEELSRSYRVLSHFTRRAGGGRAIDPRDLHVLGRRLHVAFERRADKLEIVGRGIRAPCPEPRLALYRVAERPEGWAAYSGAPAPAGRHAGPPLTRLPGVVALLAWCHFNGLIGPDTAIGIFAGEASVLDAAQVRALLAALRRGLDPAYARAGTMEALRKPPRVTAVTTFINPGVDPFARHARRGKHFTSGRCDALAYGGLAENLVLRIEQVLVTSWQEVLCHQYRGAEGLLECLRAYLRWCNPAQGLRPPPIAAQALGDYRGAGVARRVETFFEEAIAWFCSAPANACYVVAVGSGFYLLTRGAEALEYERLGSYEALLERLGAPREGWAPVAFDSHSLPDDVLPMLYARNRPGTVQVFHCTAAGHTELLILDERGSLFRQRRTGAAAELALAQLGRFLEAAAMRLDALDGRAVAAPRFYRIGRGEDGLQVQRHSVPPPPSEDFGVQALGDFSEAEPRYTVYVGGRELSSLEYGGALFEVAAAEVLRQRRSGAAYPIHLTDIDLCLGEGRAPAQTAQLLRYKGCIEERLDAALQRLRPGRAAPRAT